MKEVYNFKIAKLSPFIVKLEIKGEKIINLENNKKTRKENKNGII